ncbi:MAG: polyprenol monophosphomannose synthase [Stygiobacter sp.]|nr:MAG: dolichyl-phosphate beta-D-mannosyltransferase [Stygiobacter sp. GWC2_38_9]OGV09099.1 MAG: dolichyl-phosphate beta-D-mannosyltransferase [Stygiobacter sp. RIFOXYB2_FULL_37_11]OGV16325.1 MAG: dolichyl-phosphate beta-D-mannosyltransferase [Stygiobacter sp. RIFOXYC2_FULL_38_25]OGV81583.1 MAG: dolichyl-phosphate beta-D-mannosyltransferase [Stygiobacter sp. GWF2_38_21]RJQ64711.1 MAG: polyprenol monophosphomannose synthase [Stygiobacter sp.]
MKALVIIPTYNEIHNIKRLLPDILSSFPSVDVLVVDDNSPDGTAGWVKEAAKTVPRIKIIERPGKMGLGTAYVAGFKYMLANGYDYAIQMDADFSHDPQEIETFLEMIKQYDLVIGSRYIYGVRVINWPIRRLLLSYGANLYTRIITGMPIKDGTGGFKCFRKEVLSAINLEKIHSNGYSFQIEMNYKAYQLGFKIVEVPITFVDRVEGTSKMSKKIVREAITMVWKLRLKSIFGTLN